MKRFIVSYCFILFFLLPVYTFAQQTLADSIEKKLKENLSDSARLNNMVLLAMFYEPVDAAKAHRLYADARTAATEKKLPYYTALSYRYEATLHSIEGNKNRQLDNLEQCIAMLKNAGDSLAVTQTGLSYSDLAGYYRLNGDLKKAAENYFKAVTLLEKINSRRLGVIFINLSMVYHDMGQYDDEKKYLDKALGLARSTGNPMQLFQAYTLSSQYYTGMKAYTSAAKLVDSARMFYSDNYDFLSRYTYLLISAVTAQNLNRLDTAVEFYTHAYQLAGQNNSEINTIEPLLQTGYIKMLQGKYAAAEADIKRALQVAIKDSSLVHQKEAYETLSAICSKTGRYKEAFDALVAFNTAKDSLAGTEKINFTKELEAKYETEKKDSRLQYQEAALQQERYRNFTLTGSAAGAVLLLLLLLAYYRQRQKLQVKRIAELETEKKLTATESVLKGEEKERTRLAKDLHDGLSGMLSGVKFSLQHMQGNLVLTPENQQHFERSMDMLDNSIKEMRRVAQNMMPESLIRYGLDKALHDFATEINKTGIMHMVYESMGMEHAKLAQTPAIAIYRIIQELVNNILKHAAATEVLVQLLHQEDKLIINVDDNGRGFDTSTLDTTPGMGWGNIRSRVDYLKGRLDVQSAPGKGTAVSIELNLPHD